MVHAAMHFSCFAVRLVQTLDPEWKMIFGLLPLLSPCSSRGCATGDSGAMALVACLERSVGEGEEGGSQNEASADRRATGKAAILSSDLLSAKVR